MLTLAGDESLKFVAGEHVVEVEQIETVSFNEVDLLPAVDEVAVMFFEMGDGAFVAKDPDADEVERRAFEDAHVTK